MANQNLSSKHPIVWAIDPYEAKYAHRTPLAKTIRAFSHRLSQKVLPFSVISPGGLPWVSPLPFPESLALEKAGAKVVQSQISKLHLRGAGPAQIQLQESSSRRDLVRDVMRFARAKNAAFIAVNTKRLLSRAPFKVGGFAEALIGNSEIPVLAVSPKAKAPTSLKRILFPTDFSRASHRAFHKTLELAKKFGAEIELLYVERPILFPFAYPNLVTSIGDAYLMEAKKAEHRSAQSGAKRWCAQAGKLGVSCHYQKVRGSYSVADSILKAAKRTRADLISLASYRSPRTPALMGGTVRDILSRSRLPVLEIRAA